MDAYPISFTPTSRRNSSRIYQDLASVRLHSVVDLDQNEICKVLSKMASPDRVCLPNSTSKVYGPLTHSFQDRVNEPAPETHIAVIGAGLAGLRCADVLLRHNFRVTLIEGRDRIGGRVCQERLPGGQLADMGPNWIHGTDNNPILDAAKQTNTMIGTRSADTCVYDDTGRMLTPEGDSDIYRPHVVARPGRLQVLKRYDSRDKRIGKFVRPLLEQSRHDHPGDFGRLPKDSNCCTAAGQALGLLYWQSRHQPEPEVLLDGRMR